MCPKPIKLKVGCALLKLDSTFLTWTLIFHLYQKKVTLHQTPNANNSVQVHERCMHNPFIAKKFGYDLLDIRHRPFSFSSNDYISISGFFLHKWAVHFKLKRFASHFILDGLAWPRIQEVTKKQSLLLSSTELLIFYEFQPYLNVKALK